MEAWSIGKPDFPAILNPDSFHAIKRSRHFVRNHSGTCNHAVDQVLVNELGNLSGHTFVDVRPATGYGYDFAAARFGLYNPADGIAQKFSRRVRQSCCASRATRLQKASRAHSIRQDLPYTIQVSLRIH